MTRSSWSFRGSVLLVVHVSSRRKQFSRTEFCSREIVRDVAVKQLRGEGRSVGAITPKGKAMGLHMSNEFIEGREAFERGDAFDNPYNFFDDYEKHYAWAIGYQAARNDG